MKISILLLLTFLSCPGFADEEKPVAEPKAVKVTPPLLQSKIKGLLIVTLADGSFAGTASQMNATVVPAIEGVDFDVRFNQKVGKQMQAATKEVTKLMRVRHAGKLPAGHIIELGFSDKHSLKDGPSAAVASALMANAIITGKKLDQGFAATGDITATGEVRPVGGVGAKIRGASRKGCTLFSVPKGNAQAISDLYITDGLKAICEIQIIAIENFEQAEALAQAEKDPDIAEALAEFALVRKAVLKNPKNARHKKVLEKLRAILKMIPQHESARLVALHGRGRGPKRLSLAGSLHEIDKAASELVRIVKRGDYQSAGSLNDPLWANVVRMTKLRDSVDVRTKPYLDSFFKTANYIKQRRERKYYNKGEIEVFNSLVQSIGDARAALRRDRSVQEEFLDQ